MSRLEVRWQRGVATIELTNGRANTIDVELCHAIEGALIEVQTQGASAVVLTGRGEAFSAGLDLRKLVAHASSVLPMLNALRSVLGQLVRLEIPLIAAVNGHALGGGFLLGAAADRIVMARGKGRVGVPEALLGVPFPAIAFELLRERAGRWTAEFAFLGVTCGDEEALAKGVVDELVARDALLLRAVSLAELLGEREDVFASNKGQLRQPMFDRLARDGQSIDTMVDTIWTSERTLAQLRAYTDAHLSRE